MIYIVVVCRPEVERIGGVHKDQIPLFCFSIEFSNEKEMSGLM